MDTSAASHDNDQGVDSNISSAALIACAVVIVLASWLLAGLQLYADRQNRIDEGQTNIGNLADVLHDHTVSNLEIVRQNLVNLTASVNIDLLKNPSAAPQFHQLLERRRSATPSVVAFSIVDENGQLIHSSSMPSPGNYNMSDLSDFQTLKNNPDIPLTYTSYVYGRYGAAKDIAIFSVSHRLTDSDGNFKGIVRAAVGLQQFGKSFRALRIGTNSIVGLLHTDGVLMVRNPDTDTRAGKNYRDLPAVKDMLGDADGSGVMEVPYASGKRYQAYRRLKDYPFIVYVAAAEKDILAPWHDNVMAGIIGQSALTLLIGLLTWLIHGALKRRTAAVAENLRLLGEARASAKEASQMHDEIEQVFAATSDGIVMVDHDFRYIMANDAFERISGSARSTFIGQTVYERMPPGAMITRNLEACKASGKMVHYENDFVSGDGTRRWVEVRMFPVRDRISIYVRDVTERRNAEQKLLESQRMDAVGRLAGGLAHDFNNMLSVIIGNVEMLADKLTEKSERRSLELVRMAASRGSEMVSRLLSFARRQPLDPKALNVSGVIKEVQGLLRRSLPENIDLQVVLGVGLWQARADAAQLDNALVNLVMNARDAMPDGGKITIEACNAHFDQTYATNADVAPGQYVQIAVSDTGFGMAPDVVAKAFEPFFTTKDAGKGTGLGLSMVYGFARQSGGHVRLYSEQGHGTTVKMYLPRADGSSAELSITNSTQIAPRGTETVLMVEDNDMVREFAHTLLTDLGYTVVPCADAETALQHVADGLKPDVMLSDIVLTGPMNGRQLADNIRRTLPHLPVLFMSGYAENAVVHHGRLDAGVHLITKPFRRYDMAVKMRAVLSEAVKIAAQ
jgi:PAS domain S-box-containing protein